MYTGSLRFALMVSGTCLASFIMTSCQCCSPLAVITFAIALAREFCHSITIANHIHTVDSRGGAYPMG